LIVDDINVNNIPIHIAIIMDGNGRWAKEQGLPRLVGHKNGVKAVKRITESCSRLNVKHLTLYTFSEQNWNRPAAEVSGLMKLFVKSLKTEIANLNDNNVRFTIIGDISKINNGIRNEILDSIEQTKYNTGLNLNLAFNYSGRQEIVNMVKNIIDSYDGNSSNIVIDEEIIKNHLYTADMPNPDLLIRTGGEYRLSNFLLWQIAYSEIYFTQTYWPSFDQDELIAAIKDYQNRERRFGKVSEQIS
tara:strand:+ start:348 stop:1082 length:735 start_codon:yes stop_codon:yes gene_type:complete